MKTLCCQCLQILVLLGLSLQSVAAAVARPNILFVFTDDHAYQAISAYGSRINSTPHIDRLAQEGMRFENCYSTPLCTPTRVQLMTGKYNFRNYIGFGLLDPNEKTF